MRTLSIYSLNNFLIYHRAVLIVIILYITSLILIYLITGTLSVLTKACYWCIHMQCSILSAYCFPKGPCKICNCGIQKRGFLGSCRDRFTNAAKGPSIRGERETEREREREQGETLLVIVIYLRWEEKCYFSHFFKQPTIQPQQRIFLNFIACGTQFRCELK